MKEKCGVFGIYTKNSSDQNLGCLIQGLKYLQHRGQESCGVAYHQNTELICEKELGLVANAFKELKYEKIKTNKCIGHVRYSTSGNSKNNEKDLYEECQPLYGKCKLGPFFLAHNGNIPNLNEHDTQYIIKFIQNSLETTWTNIFISLVESIPVAYCLLIITNDSIFAVRDKYGIRPLCIGVNNETDFCFSSESCALQHYDYVRDVKPGEIVVADDNGLKSKYVSPFSNLRLCAFECIYFMNEKSICNGMIVSEIRQLFGTKLANKETFVFDENTIVVGVPKTGIVSAKTYASTLNLPYIQAIRKNENVGRTFIAPSNKERLSLCRRKFSFDELKIKDKNIIIIDDTIVRGNVMKTIIQELYKFGAKKIHVRVPSPKIINKCSLGIDIPSCEELLAFNRTNIEIAKELRVSTINYLEYDDFDKILSFSTYKECFGEAYDYK